MSITNDSETYYPNIYTVIHFKVLLKNHFHGLILYYKQVLRMLIILLIGLYTACNEQLILLIKYLHLY